MSTADEVKFEKEVEKIEAELGEDHLVRMLRFLTSSSPESSQGLLELHSECRNVISKYQPLNLKEGKSKRTLSEGTAKRKVKENTGKISSPTSAHSRRIQTEKPRILLTKRTHPLVPLNTKKNITT